MGKRPRLLLLRDATSEEQCVPRKRGGNDGANSSKVSGQLLKFAGKRDLAPSPRSLTAPGNLRREGSGMETGGLFEAETNEMFARGNG